MPEGTLALRPILFVYVPNPGPTRRRGLRVGRYRWRLGHRGAGPRERLVAVLGHPL